MRRLIYICMIGLLLCSYTGAEEGRYASKSLLAEGKWVKIRVDKTGIYKLSYADLRKMGFEDPAKVSVHGYGGWPLEEDFGKAYVDDVPSTPVWRGGDYLLFYGRGPVRWEYDAPGQTFAHTNNPYSSYGYYFVTDATPTDEMTSVAQASGATHRVTSYDDYLVHEQELVSLAKSGRELYGEDFSGATPRTLSTFSTIEGITDEDAKVTMSFVSKVSSGTGVASLSINKSGVLDVSIPANREDYVKAVEGKSTAVWTGEKSEKNSVVVSYSSAFHSNVRLNYVRLHFKRTLRPYGAYTFFRSVASVGNVSRFVVQGADANTLVFDVTDAGQVRRMETELNGSELTFSIPAGTLREFALVQTSQSFASPEVVGEVENQDLHGLEQQEMIILAAKAFHAQAERLAEEHRTLDGLTVKVVDPQAVYNEFASGGPDATAYRRFMKMFYDRGASAGKMPKYLLLFGDGVYDNRGICPDVKGLSRDNLLLTYQSEESLSEFSSRYGYSYVTDDYYGLLDDVSEEALSGRNSMCVGVGRFPVRTVAEATQMVDKVIGYMRNDDGGSWKNQITFVADDGNNADGYTSRHAEQADELARFIEEEHDALLTNKVYFDAQARQQRYLSGRA